MDFILYYKMDIRTIFLTSVKVNKMWTEYAKHLTFDKIFDNHNMNKTSCRVSHNRNKPWKRSEIQISVEFYILIYVKCFERRVKIPARTLSIYKRRIIRGCGESKCAVKTRKRRSIFFFFTTKPFHATDKRHCTYIIPTWCL